MVFDKTSFSKKLEQSVTKLKDDFASINTRISVNILTPVKVEAYGDMKPLNQVANVSVSGSNALTVQAWDKTLQPAISKAIMTSGLGLNPAVDGAVIRVPIPPITQERRKEFVILAKQYLEHAKIAMRNIRNNERDRLKTAEKNKEMSEDDFKRADKELQKIFDDEILKCEKLLEDKNKEILS